MAKPHGHGGGAGNNGARVAPNASARAQADAHRASKGSRLQRLDRLNRKATAQSDRLIKAHLKSRMQSSGSTEDMNASDAIDRKSKHKAARVRAIRSAQKATKERIALPGLVKRHAAEAAKDRTRKANERHNKRPR